MKKAKTSSAAPWTSSASPPAPTTASSAWPARSPTSTATNISRRDIFPRRSDIGRWIGNCGRGEPMPFYLQVEIDTSLSPVARFELIIKPLMEALAAEQLGTVIDREGASKESGEVPGGTLEMVLEVTDLERGRALVERIMQRLKTGPGAKRVYHRAAGRQPTP